MSLARVLSCSAVAWFFSVASPSVAAALTPAKGLPALTPGKSQRCGGFDKKGRAALDLVEGRLGVEAPKGSADIPKAYDVMGGPEPTAHESRLILEDKKGGKFVVYARELFQSAPADLGKAAIGYFTSTLEKKEEELALGTVTVAADARVSVVAARPKKTSADGEAVLLLSTLVRAADDTLLAVDFYVNPTALKKGDGCQSYALALAQTMRAGKRALDQSGGKRTLKGMGKTVEVVLPAGYVLTSQRAEDFDVHYLRKVAPLGGYPGHLVIYVGSHPDTTAPTGSGTAVKKKGKLAGKDVEWQGYSSDKGGALVATLPLATSGNRPQVSLQVAQIATLKGDYLGELAKIADTIRTP